MPVSTAIKITRPPKRIYPAAGTMRVITISTQIGMPITWLPYSMPIWKAPLYGQMISIFLNQAMVFQTLLMRSNGVLIG